MTAVEFEEWVQWYVGTHGHIAHWEDWLRLTDKEKNQIRSTVFATGKKFNSDAPGV
jgi:hypothetical protein